MSRSWLDQDILYLRNNIRKDTYKQIAKKLKRSERAIKMKALHMGIASKKPHWLKKDEKQLRNLIRLDSKHNTYTKIAAIMHRSRFSIASKIKRLGLKINYIQ